MSPRTARYYARDANATLTESRGFVMTFRQSLGAFADNVLDKALGAVEAGACVPSNGQQCACLSIFQSFCNKQGHNDKFTWSCLGKCVDNGHTCC